MKQAHANTYVTLSERVTCPPIVSALKGIKLLQHVAELSKKLFKTNVREKVFLPKFNFLVTVHVLLNKLVREGKRLQIKTTFLRSLARMTSRPQTKTNISIYICSLYCMYTAQY
jgi:hypothetical protein